MGSDRAKRKPAVPSAASQQRGQESILKRFPEKTLAILRSTGLCKHEDMLRKIKKARTAA